MKVFGTALIVVLVLWLFASASSSTDATSVVIFGEISDSQCALDIHSTDGTHAAMIKMGTLGKTPEECATVCVRRGGEYVLVDEEKNKVYRLANPELASQFAAKKVRVRGAIDSNGVLTISAIEAR